MFKKARYYRIIAKDGDFMSNIKKHNFSKKILDFLILNKFEKLTLVQDEVIDLMLNKEDVIAVADTGTGKTHAFLIPILELVNSQEDRVQAVISAPTRELASQIYDFAKMMNEIDADLKIELVVGGMDKIKMRERLSNNPHIVIGTPGRLRDMFVNEASLRLDQADIFVVDEADMTFEFGFLEDIDNIISRMKADVQVAVFSATILKAVNQFLNKYLNNPQTIRIKSNDSFSPNIDHILINARHLEYEHVLKDLLPTINPYVCVIFANTRAKVSETAAYLRSLNFKVLEVSGGLSSRARMQALRALKAHEYTYIVATDIAARGLDIEGITHVISLGLPEDLNFYIHRSGRTGRTKRHGYSYIVYNKSDLNSIHTLRNQGLSFSFKQIRNNQLVSAKSIFVERKADYSEDKEIAKVLYRKNQKVKPGYKKKRKRAIEKIKGQRIRQMIQESIKEQKKARNKAKQIAKRGNKK